jgi:hypothetical protein
MIKAFKEQKMIIFTCCRGRGCPRTTMSHAGKGDAEKEFATLFYTYKNKRKD